MAVFLNLIGLITIVPTTQVLEQVSYTYSNSILLWDWFERVNSYDNIWGALFYLIPLLIILNLALTIYLYARRHSVT